MLVIDNEDRVAGAEMCSRVTSSEMGVPHSASPVQVILATVMQVFGVDQSELLGPSRGLSHVAHARQVAMYLARVDGNMQLTEIGRAFGRDRTTVRHACSIVEDRRDNPDYDLTLVLIAGIIRRLCALSSPSRVGSPV